MTTNTTNSAEIHAFTEKLSSSQRFRLGSEKYTRRFRLLFLLTITGIVGLSLVFLFQQKPTFIDASLFLFLVILLSISWLTLDKRLHHATLKGDALILRSMSNKSSVTSIKSVRKVRTYNILGLKFTSLNYYIDGRHRKSILLGSRPGSSFTVEYFIIVAISWSKKKKANHKPGSVLAH